MENLEIPTEQDKKLHITNSKVFINMLKSENIDNANENYQILRSYGMKQKASLASEVNQIDYDGILNFAIVKAINNFDESHGAQLQSFFWEKLRGEVSAYRTKRDSLQKKILAIVNNSEESFEYHYQKDADGENYLEAIDSETMEEKIELEATYLRQIKAFKMAFSGIPLELQIILNEVGAGKKIKEISTFLQLDEDLISKKRNYGLSLILQRVMRSHHLNEEEKHNVADLHGFKYSTDEI